VIVKNGGGRMLEQPLPMSSALRASAWSLGFLMGYIIYQHCASVDKVLNSYCCKVYERLYYVT